MNKVTFTLTTSRPSKSSKFPVYLRFYYANTEFVFPTGEKCLLSEWDTDKQKFRRSMPGYQQANEYLEGLSIKLRTAYRSARSSDSLITNDYLRGELGGKVSGSRSVELVSIFEEYVRLRIVSDGLAKGTVTAMNSSAVRMKRFRDTGVTLRINGYTDQIHQSFMSHMFQAQDLEPSSVANTCKHLITFFKWASKTYALSPGHAEIKKETFDSDRIYLTEVELRKIEMVALPMHLNRVRDAFLFQCYTGLRYTDLWRLESRHIEKRDGYTVLSLIADKSVSRSGKTKRLEIPLLPEAVEIMNRYDGQYRLLPILSNQKYNQSIKEVARLAGILELVEAVEYSAGNPQIAQVPKWQRVSTHVARHTFATLSLMKGVPLEVVSKALGHTKLATTMIYAKVVDEWKNQIILNAWKKVEPEKSNPDPDA